MKKLFFILLLPFSAIAQDTIITTSGKIIACEVLLIDKGSISYKDWSGLTATINNSDILEKIIHSNPKKAEDVVAVTKKADEVKPVVFIDKTKPNEINLAGIELIKARRNFYTGFILMVIGGALVSYAALGNPNTDVDARRIVYYSGGIIGTVGWGINISAFFKVGKAGKHLVKYKPE